MDVGGIGQQETRGDASERDRSVHHRLLEFTLFAGSIFAFQASRLGTGLYAAAVLPPVDYGLWGISLAVLSYSNYGNLGVLSGANRNIPLHLGSRDESRAAEVESAALAFSGISGLTIAVALLFGVLAVQPQPIAAYFSLIGAVGLQQLYLFYQVSLRGRLDFNAASFQQVILAVLFPLVAIPLLPLAGVTSLVLAQATALLAGTLIGAVAFRRAIHPVLAGSVIRELIQVGLPIMLAGLAFAVLVTADRWLALWLLGERALGEYTLASLLSSAMLLTSTVVGQQFYPRMAIVFGRTRDPSAALAIGTRQALAIAAFTLPFALLIVFAAPSAIERWFPAYQSSVGVLQLLVVGFVVLLSGTSFASVLIVLGKSRTYLGILVGGIVVEIVVALGLAAVIGGALINVAVAATVAFSAVGLTLLAASFMAVRGSSS